MPAFWPIPLSAEADVIYGCPLMPQGIMQTYISDQQINTDIDGITLSMVYVRKLQGTNHITILGHCSVLIHGRADGPTDRRGGLG